MPVANGVPRESVSAAVAVSSTATAPNKANTLRFMSPSPRLTLTESVYQTNQGWQDQTTEAHDLNSLDRSLHERPRPGLRIIEPYAVKDKSARYHYRARHDRRGRRGDRMTS